MAEEDPIKALVSELRTIFHNTFVKQGKTYGPKVGLEVRLKIVENGNIKAALLEESGRLEHLLLSRSLKLAPEVVRDLLVPKYRSLGEQFPYKEINANTRLTNEDRAIITSKFLISIIAELLRDGDQVRGFYSEKTDTIVVARSSTNAGVLAHEMAHNYAYPNWREYMFWLACRHMKDTRKVDEGLAIVIADIVSTRWHDRHPREVVPDTGSGYDKTYLERANDFIKAVGKDRVFEAYFAGCITSKGGKPEDLLFIGRDPKKWKWPWR